MVLLCSGGALCAGSCAQKSAPGEVVLLVSTDLAIPSDADTLHVTVTRTGASAPFLDESYPLTGDAAVHLPGTVALVSGEQSQGLVQIHVELLQGSPGVAKEAVRVQRDAQLELPNADVKELPMPLDFLCAEGSPPTPCPAGQTCDVGQCVDDTIADSSKLDDYVATVPVDCFDVRACFAIINGGNMTVPQFDSNENLGCSIKTPQVGNAKDINVALIVNTAAVGNYGVCDASSGKCLIPLDQGPNGWHTLTDSSQGAIAIGFPDAVCLAVVGKSIAGVAITPTSAACPLKRTASALCPASATCISPSGIVCPSAWSGFSCSAGICPPDWSSPYCFSASTSTPPSFFCGEAARDPKTGPVVPGLWCCGPTDAPPGEPDLLIDDMSSGPFIKLKPPDGDNAGIWFSSSDDINADLSPPETPALFTFRAIDPAATPMEGLKISHAACLRSDQGIEGYDALEGFTFSGKPPDYSAVSSNLSQYTGISFWAYAAPGKIVDETGAPLVPTEIHVEFPNQDTYTEIPDSTCVSSPGGRASCDQFGQAVTLTKDWTQYEVRWDGLAQAGFGTPFLPFNKTQVYATDFVVNGPGRGSRSLPFDFCIAQIQFIEN
jgi:hypothetical protein